MQQRTAYDQNWKEIVTHLTAEFRKKAYLCVLKMINRNNKPKKQFKV